MIKLHKPGKAENAAINRGIALDPDTTEITDFRNAKRGRPKLENPKKAISLRLDMEVIEHFKASGKGWQTRINEVLRKSVDAG